MAMIVLKYVVGHAPRCLLLICWKRLLKNQEIQLAAGYINVQWKPENCYVCSASLRWSILHMNNQHIRVTCYWYQHQQQTFVYAYDEYVQWTGAVPLLLSPVTIHVGDSGQVSQSINTISYINIQLLMQVHLKFSIST